ncbi:MAG TPA: hypothetical protein VK679_04650 [Gemmatimonadaceae bacterium]|jgi:hypothetical protein|nr:hypothetical protein [Gemmatimonadaceae bacterium]
MLDAIGTILILTTAAVILVAMTRRLLFAGIAGAWVGLAVVAAASGALDGSPFVLLFLFGLPLIVAALAWQRPTVRAAWLAIPLPLLIGLNVFRSLGFMFLLLAANGRLSGPFPYSAGWGDIITGVFALPVALAVARGTASRGLVAAWNAFGLLDLIVAVGLGVVSAAGSPVQLIHAGVGSAAITHLPWSLVPTALVPFFILTHAVVFAQLRARAPRRVPTAAAVRA